MMVPVVMMTVKMVVMIGSDGDSIRFYGELYVLMAPQLGKISCVIKKVPQFGKISWVNKKSPGEIRKAAVSPQKKQKADK